MAKRRGDGEGSIYQAKDGRWRAEISLGYADGKPRRKILYAPTRAELSAKLKQALQSQQTGIDLKPVRQTVGTFLRSWLSGTVAPRNSSDTLRSYTWIVNSHLIPHLGRIALEKLSPQDVQALLADRHRHVGATTVKHIRATLRSALSQAERWGLVYRNVAKLVTVPRQKRYIPRVLSGEEARRLVAHLNETPREAMYLIGLTLGLRRGEVLGLHWEDIDFATGMLHVRRTLRRVKGAGLQLGEPKSAKSSRRLRLPLMAVQALLRWREQQALDRDWASTRWKLSDFVFTSSIGTPVSPETYTAEFPAVLTAAGLPRIRPHDLRHSCATLLLTMGVHPKLVQETLGHSTFQLTMDTYSHVMPELRNEVADRMDDALAAPTPTTAPTKPATEQRAIRPN